MAHTDVTCALFIADIKRNYLGTVPIIPKTICDLLTLGSVIHDMMEDRAVVAYRPRIEQDFDGSEIWRRF